ncbi:hypothetical protein [Nocardioides mangrovi]|nr:hypothetical protein [Nocardioides mangrovi]
MTAMLMPAVVVAPASAAEVEAEWMSGHAGMAGMAGMSDKSMGAPSGHAGHGAMAMPPTWLAVAMLAVLVVLVVAAIAAAVRPAHRPTAVRWGVAGELVMAGAMAYMAAMAA